MVVSGFVSAKIRASYLTLLPSEQKVANYLLTYPTESLKMPIDELAATVGVSKTTIVRFCKRLGYIGFKEFKYDFVFEAGEEKDILTELAGTDSAREVFEKASHANCQAIEHTKAIIDFDALEYAVENILNARKIILLANGGSSVVALDFYHKFLRIGIECTFNFDMRLQEMAIRLLKPDDLAIGFSFSGGNPDVIRCLDLADKQGASTMGFTNTLDSPITKVSKTVICASNTVKSKVTGSIEPRIALLNIVDTLFMLTVIANHDEATQSLTATLEVLEKARLDSY